MHSSSARTLFPTNKGACAKSCKRRCLSVRNMDVDIPNKRERDMSTGTVISIPVLLLLLLLLLLLPALLLLLLLLTLCCRLLGALSLASSNSDGWRCCRCCLINIVDAVVVVVDVVLTIAFFPHSDRTCCCSYHRPHLMETNVNITQLLPQTIGVMCGLTMSLSSA